MSIDLEALLPDLLPRAIEWVEAQFTIILASGSPLTEIETSLAEAVGVTHPEKIRIKSVKTFPLPDDLELRSVALQTGLLGPGIVGITFGYGIYVRDGFVTNRLVSHECRHVYQYEQAGSIAAFLPIYLQQIATVGYHDAPLEVDARKHELDA
ncbi:MAG: hypothetical protein P8X81_02595 [Woeseiaceae bacterium]